MMTAETPWPAEVTKPTDAKTAMMYWHERAMAAERDLTAAREQIAELDGTVRTLAAVQTELIAERNAARARVAELETVLADFLSEDCRDEDDPILVAIKDRARALLSPSPEPTK